MVVLGGRQVKNIRVMTRISTGIAGKRDVVTVRSWFRISSVKTESRPVGTWVLQGASHRHNGNKGG